MCFTIPQKIIQIEKDEAVFENNSRARLSLVKCKAGDYALVQKGFVVKKIKKGEAKETLALLKGGL